MGSRRKPSRGGGGGGRSEPDLHAAARSGDIRAVESICAANPLAVNSRDRHSRTPLHLAAWSGQTEVVSYLCKNKADIGAAAMDDTAAIHFASQKGHLEVVRVLLSSGVSVKAANRKGLTPLHYAAQGSHLELVKYLVKKGASLTAKTKSGQSPLDVAENDQVREYLEECKQMLKKGEDPATNQSIKESVVASDAKISGVNADTGDREIEKREGEEANEDGSPKAKKARISLEHLVAENDAEDASEE